MRFLLTTTAVTGLAVASMMAASAQGTQTFSKNSSLELTDYIGTTDVIVADVDQISVTITPGDGDKEPVLAEVKNGVVTIYSEKKPDRKNFWRRMNWERHGDEAFQVFLKDYPSIQVTVPEGTDITVDGIASYLTVGSTNADFVSEKTIYVEGSVGDVERADVHITGAGELTFGKVTNDLEAKISGSGDLSFNSAATADLSISGSGDINVNEVLGDTSAAIRGSGDIEVTSILGSADLSISGSGDISTGKVGKGADASIRGSGDIQVAEVNGPSSVTISGNGDVDFKGGRAEDLTVKITGSGDFDFNGVAVNPNVRIGGSGDVNIDAYEGKVSVKGGDVTIGDLTFER
jgi:hypothetical protein